MIKLSYDVLEYRQQLLNLLQNGDVVVELGCHVGGTTKLILDNFSDINMIAVDNSPEAISAMSKIDCNFIKGDVRLHDVLKKVYKIIRECDVLAIDLGGGYHPDTVFKVFYIWSSTFKPKHTLIRNRGLVEFSNSTITCEDYKSKSGYLESYGDSGIPPQIKEFELWTPNLVYK